VTNVMRSLCGSGAETDTLPTILRLAHLLDAVETPIDYARRRSLDHTELLPARRVGEHSHGPRPLGSSSLWTTSGVVSGSPRHREPVSWHPRP